MCNGLREIVDLAYRCKATVIIRNLLIIINLKAAQYQGYSELLMNSIITI